MGEKWCSVFEIQSKKRSHHSSCSTVFAFRFLFLFFSRPPPPNAVHQLGRYLYYTLYIIHIIYLSGANFIRFNRLFSYIPNVHMFMCIRSEWVNCIFAEWEKKWRRRKNKNGKKNSKNVATIRCKIVRHFIWNGSWAKCNWYFNLFKQLTILQIQRSIYCIYLCYIFGVQNGWMEHVICVCCLTFVINYDFIIWIDAPNRRRKTENGI